MCIRDRLALRLVDPEAKDILAAVDVIGKHDIDGHLLDAILRAQRYVDAVSYTHLDVYKRQR